MEITSHPRNAKIEIKQNETLKLECTVRMAKPAATIIWYRENVPIKGGDVHVTAVSIADGQYIKRLFFIFTREEKLTMHCLKKYSLFHMLIWTHA